MTTTWEFIPKPGTTSGGWNYDESGYTYDQAYDPSTGAIVYYDGAGLSTAYVNQVKN